MIQINKVTNWARATYDAAPGPRTMLVILDAMWAQLNVIADLRGEISGSFDALDAFDADANKFLLRLQSYLDERDRMEAGEITGGYTMHVVRPVLFGNGAYASAGREAWSKTTLPDVATAFSLQNQLEAFVEHMGAEDPDAIGGFGVVTDLLDRIRSAVLSFTGSIAQGGEDLVRRYAGAAGDEAAAQAGEELEKRAHRLVDELKPKIQEQAAGGVSMAVLGGLALVGVIVFVTRGRK